MNAMKAAQNGRQLWPTTQYHFTIATLDALAKLDPKTVDGDAQLRGMKHAEPLILMLDCLYQYAAVYKSRFEGNLADDQVLGAYWLDALKGVHGLLNGDGVVAMQHDITTDSKSNGACEDVYWAARRIAGFADNA